MTKKTKKNPFKSLDDFIAIPRVNSLASKNGRLIASTAELAEKKDSWKSHLNEFDGDRSRRITRSPKGESLMAIGERGELYFTSGRKDDEADDGVTSIWMLPPSGEARVVIRRAGGINSITPAGGRLYITAPLLPGSKDAKHNDETLKTRKERGMSGILYENFPVRFWDHDLGPARDALYETSAPSLYGDEISELKRIEIPVKVLGDGLLDGVSVSDDGESILVAITRTDADTKTQPYTSTYLIKPETKLVAEGSTSDMYSYYPGEFNPSGTKAVIGVSFGSRQGNPLNSWMEILDLETFERTRFIPDFDNWPGQSIWLDDETIAFTADRQGRASIYTATIGDAEPHLVTNDDEAYSSIALTDDGAIAAIQNGVGTAPRAVKVSLTGTVSDLHTVEPTKVPGKLDEVFAKGKDGTDVRAWLALPNKANDEKPVELLVFVHGGPWGSWNSWTWRWNPWVFVAQGYAVLLPDPAISTGYGQNMIDRGSDAIGDVPFTDILALIDATEARADINGERTAVLGGSYGGYMANWFAGHTGDRFSCIVSHASLWDTDMMGRTTDNGIWYEWMKEQPEYSPHLSVDKIETPMLVIHGDKDYRVPVGQSQALWFQLLHDSKVDGHKFLYFPDENHWILKPSNSVLWYETVLAFVETHVRGKKWKAPELLG